ncbi:hypothetical protein HYDPIDRAFT_112006 [Hydnomerulius pinastri MD-312]|uniref:Methyltransferase n=1 Tax=Hydnomerulius pinastri MD-312 TaxID=994086 RepID=A0A0C9VGC4_9AGAM|nr:hypothetical protein HYDPIDRAFT_112006 [Hydnomerulius pinastri MD-312]
MTVAVLAPRDVPTTLNYYAAIGDQPAYNYVYDPPAGVPKSNVGEDVRPTVVHDARGKEASLGLDVSGFQFVKYPSVEKEFVDDEKIQSDYYPEVERILKEYAGAKRVFIFDHTIRRSPVDQRPGEPSKAPLRGPVQRVHVDQTFVAAAERVRLHLGDEAERLLKGRYRIINVWRPIGNPVAHNPLAVADYRTVNPDEDLISTRHIYPTREGSTFSVKYSQEHKWYYLSDQTPDEVTLIKCFDSDVDKARLTPHSAFKDNSSAPEAPQRQSIEVRALVFDSE